MPSAIRDWLSSAQAAENRGDKPEAIRFLKRAAEFYFERGLTPRGEQVLRQVRRLEEASTRAPATDDALGFGDALLPEAKGARTPYSPSGSGQAEPAPGRDPRAGAGPPATPFSPSGGEGPSTSSGPAPRREASLADPRLDAWCSFCCRPKEEAGPLVAGPAGAFICRSCTAGAARLLEGAPE